MMKDIDIDNVGIMSGFTEDFDRTLAEALSDEGLGGEEEGYETGKIMDRKPDSPEILMNNLRGDMRSVDARREELADMVGYGAAMETPDEVLAILQDHFAMMDQAPAMGIGALPEAPQQPAPPPMAQGPAPQQPPINMAKGGYVQNFALGSDEDGVTPATTTSGINLPPAMAALAQQNVGSFLGQKPSEVPDLKAAMDKRMPMYEELLGGDSDMTQAQALLALSQAAFDWAGGKSFGEAASGASATLTKLAGQKQKEDRAVKLAAMQAAEKDIDNIRSANTKLIANQQKTWAGLYKEALKGNTTGVWSKNKAHKNIAMDTDLIRRYALGQTTPAEDHKVELANESFKYFSKDRTKTYQNEFGRTVVDRVKGEAIPDFWLNAIATRASIDAGTAPPELIPEKPVEDVKEEVAPTEEGLAYGTLTPSQTRTQYPEYGQNTTKVTSVDPRTHNYFRPDEKTVFNMVLQRNVTGPINATFRAIAGMPIIGPELAGMDETEAKSFVISTVQELNAALRTNPRFSDTERKELKSELDVLPKVFDNEEAFIARMRGLDSRLQNLFSNQMRTLKSDDSYEDQKKEARQKIADIHDVRRNLGLPIFVKDTKDPRVPYLAAKNIPFIDMNTNKWTYAKPSGAK